MLEREHFLGPKQRLLDTYLTARSGAYTAEAFGILALKVFALVLGGFLVHGITMAFEEDDAAPVFAVLLLGPAVLALAWIGLVLYTGLVLDRLNPRYRFRPLPRPMLRARRTPATLPELPPSTMRSSLRGHADLCIRTAISLLLGTPVVLLIGYCLIAYGSQLRRWLTNPHASFVAWQNPASHSAFGAWFFRDEQVLVKVLVVLVSVIALVSGIALARLLFPLLFRRGADAIELAVTPTGAIVRGGLEISWDEIVEVLVVRDRRITAGTRRRRQHPESAEGHGAQLNPTFFRAHSRTRIVLVLRDLPSVAARAGGFTPPAHRSLRAERTRTFGFALCDVWTHSHDEVDAVVDQLVEHTDGEGIRLTQLVRRVHAH